MKNKNAFTLAETMIVLVILGVIASITIPALVNRHMEAERRTKLRKAMTVYDTALNKMVIENGIKSDTALVNWADSNTKNDCANTSAYFKVSRNLEVNENETHCKFRAPDGVFWDISDIKKPLVALREQDLNDATAQSGTNRAFYMFGWLDEQGSLRSNDMGKISATDKDTLEKLYDFIAGKTKTSMEEVEDTQKYSWENELNLLGSSSKECVNPIFSDGKCTNCINCTITKEDPNDNNYNMYDVYDSYSRILSNYADYYDPSYYVYANATDSNPVVKISYMGDCTASNDNVSYCNELGFTSCDVSEYNSDYSFCYKLDEDNQRVYTYP